MPETSKTIHRGSFLRHPSRSDPGPSSERIHISFRLITCLVTLVYQNGETFILTTSVKRSQAAYLFFIVTRISSEFLNSVESRTSITVQYKDVNNERFDKLIECDITKFSSADIHQPPEIEDGHITYPYYISLLLSVNPRMSMELLKL